MPLRFSIFITTVHLHMVGRTSMCTEQNRKLTLNVLLPIYMYTYAFIIHVTEYERLKITIPVERSFEFYLHFIPPFCLIFKFNFGHTMMVRIPDLTLPRIPDSTTQTHITFKVLTTKYKDIFQTLLGLARQFSCSSLYHCA